MSEEMIYRTVEVVIDGIRPDSVWVANAPGRGPGVCNIPRSLLHGGDDLKLARLGEGDRVPLRVTDWKAEELGFA